MESETSKISDLDFIEEKKSGEGRAASSLRMKYMAEAHVIRKQLGGLEAIRSELGLSRRKMCQLLMVDPSAWTRWLQNEDQVPPHIWRALQWYLALIDKSPVWHPQNSNLGAFRTAPYKDKVYAMELKVQDDLSHVKSQAQNMERQVQGFTDDLKFELGQLKRHLNEQIQAQSGWKFMLLFNTFALIVFALYKLIF